MNVLAYCTNVHAGPDLSQTLTNLERYALAVQARYAPNQPMGVGLWLAADAARECLAPGRIAALRDWLAQRQLVPFTFNGFPYGDFHQPVVKHAVYLPTWWQSARLDYTRDLITILHGVLPPGLSGSISTLPIAWGSPTPQQLRQAAAHLRQLADELSLLEAQTGRLIHLNLEPEPGCYLDTAADVVAFFQEYLLVNGNEEHIRRYLRVCHDVCHAAVMFEEQADVLDTYRRAGVLVGKVQVSSAVGLNLTEMAEMDRAAAMEQLRSFAEPRYLHQTLVKRAGVTQPIFYEDLPQALADPPGEEYRTHFHVPIYLDRFGRLQALQRPILDWLHTLQPQECEHFEVETYAWSVLPPELQVTELAEGIAREMDWLRERLAAVRMKKTEG
ncbi:MAG: metabolite traffic protein EboE [Gemmataceae bacterium]